VKTVYKGKEAYREELMDKEREAMAFPNAAHGGQEMERPFIFILSSKFKLRALIWCQ
jgi:hypothetical protein